MASQVLTDAKLFAGGYDLSGDSNALALEYGADMLDGSTFGVGTRVNQGGPRTVIASAEGFWNDPADAVLDANLGLGDVPIIIAPSGVDGEVAFLFRAVEGEYERGSGYGELFGFSVSMEGSDGAPLVRGRLLRPAGLVGASGAGSGAQLGQVAAGKRLYGALHVLSASGTTPTLDVIVQSDDLSGFGTPTTRLTFPQRTAAGTYGWQTVAGPITDDWYRVSFTLGGTSPQFNFVVAVGIA